MVIIDGYNLLWSIQKTDESLESISDVSLCKIIEHYLKLVREKGEIIFDGKGPPDRDAFERGAGNLEVIYAGIAKDADTLIECKISVDTAPKRLTIVSSDRRLRDAARRRKASAIKSEIFWSEVQKQLSRKKNTLEPPQKRRGLSEGEAKQWLELFGLDQQQ